MRYPSQTVETVSGVEERWVPDTEASELTGINVKTLRRWRQEGRGPAFVRPGGTLVRYSTRALADWMASQPSGGEYVTPRICA